MSNNEVLAKVRPDSGRAWGLTGPEEGPCAVSKLKGLPPAQLQSHCEETSKGCASHWAHLPIHAGTTSSTLRDVRRGRRVKEGRSMALRLPGVLKGRQDRGFHRGFHRGTGYWKATWSCKKACGISHNLMTASPYHYTLGILYTRMSHHFS